MTNKHVCYVSMVWWLWNCPLISTSMKFNTPGGGNWLIPVCAC